MSERIDFSKVNQINPHKWRLGFFTRRVPGKGSIEVSPNAGSAADVERLIAHVEKENARREAENRKVIKPQADFQI